MKEPPHPADELAEIRAEIARLRLREGQLRHLMLQGPPDLRSGRWFQVEMRETVSRKLDPARLPDALRHDPAIYCESRRTVLHCRANLLSSALMPGPWRPAQDRWQ